MNLLIYSHAFAPQVGGIETFTAYLANGLARPNGDPTKEDFTVTVVTQTPETQGSVSAGPLVRVVRQPSPLELWRLIGSAHRILLAGPAILPLAFALLRRKAVIVSHHGYQSICPNGMLFQFPLKTCCPGHFAAGSYGECLMCNTPQEGITGSVRLLGLTFVRRVLSRFAGVNVAVSEHVAMRIALPRLRVIRNGVPDVPLHELPHAIASGAPPTFAYVGRLVTEKGLPVLLQAAWILKSRGCRFEVLILGDGPEREALQELASSLNLYPEVSFLGFQRGSDLKEVMNRVSALVMPSICEDAAPFSVLEQMMQGKLIIGSDIGGLAEEVGDAGLLFPPGNATALADHMEHITQQPELTEQHRTRARERAREHYTLQRLVLEYRDLLFSQ